jgi:hypothetical protein
MVSLRGAAITNGVGCAEAIRGAASAFRRAGSMGEHSETPMCYSAQIWADYRKYVRMFGVRISIHEFVDLFWHRQNVDDKLKVPKSLESWFADPQTEEERQVKALIDEFNVGQAVKFEQELFKQRKRLADAERALQTKVTKKDTESKRIATDKVQWAIGKLAALRRTELEDDDSRIFPGWYAPVMVIENGERVIKPMRYQCRPAGKPAFYDVKFPGTYNAMGASLTVRTAQILQHQ